MPSPCAWWAPACTIECVTGEDYFKQVLRDALALLKGDGLPPEEADEQRDRLLAGFQWILVDEYQDIGPDEYELIAAIVGRSLQDEERKLSLSPLATTTRTSMPSRAPR